MLDLKYHYFLVNLIGYFRFDLSLILIIYSNALALESLLEFVLFIFYFPLNSANKLQIVIL